MEVQEQPQQSVDTVIAAYVKLRNEKERINNEAKAKTKVIDDRLKKLEAWMHLKMHQDGVNAFNTDAGTAYKTTVEHASVSDMNDFIEYVKANDAWDLLEKRVSKTGVRALLDEGEPLPAGVNWYTSTAIHVRKPNER